MSSHLPPIERPEGSSLAPIERPQGSHLAPVERPHGSALAPVERPHGSHLPPIERPHGLMLKMGYWYTRKKFGKVPGPLSVFCARMPAAFTSFYGKISKLDKKLELSADTAILIRERVASTNMCLYCMDATRWHAANKAPHNVGKLDALHAYRTSPLFSDAERVALDYATELTENEHVNPETFKALSRHYSEREICDIVWIVASEHLYNITNIGLNIGSDAMCEVPSVSA